MSQTSILPPHSLTAEKALLGAVLKDPNIFLTVVDLVKADYFYLELHRVIYGVIVDLDADGRSPDIITVAEIARDRRVQGLTVAYLSELVDSCPVTLNIDHYAVLVRDYFVRRTVIDRCRDIIKRSTRYEGKNDEYLEEVERDFLLATDVQQKVGLVSVQDVLMETLDELDRRMKLEGELSGVTSGFRELDILTSGWQKHDLVILAARPGMGKTALGLNFVINAVKRGYTTIVFSLEMSRSQLMMRLLSSETRINSSKIRNGKLTEGEQDQVLAGIKYLTKLPATFSIDDSSEITISEIRARCRRFKRDNKGKLDLVVVDYLQLIGRGSYLKYENREREISEVSRNLKSLAKELDVPVVSLAQLNRSPDSRVDKRPRMSDLRESGSMEQDADLVLFIYRDEYYYANSPDAGKAELIIGKNRHGPMSTIDLAFHADLVSFHNRPSY